MENGLFGFPGANNNPVNRVIGWSGPPTLATGADTLEVPVPSDFGYNGRALKSVTLRLGTVGSTATTLTLQGSKASGAFSASYTSDTFTIPSSVGTVTINEFVTPIYAAAGDMLRFNIGSLGTSAANLSVETEWL